MSTQKTEQLKSLLLASPEIAGQRLSVQEVEQLVQYYALVLKWNPQLHLTTITEPEEFFRRHLCETVFLAQHLALEVVEVWDLGTGLGVPGIPLAILRPDLQVKLVESSRRKAVFLDEAVFRTGNQNLAVLSQRFEALPVLPPRAAITARAVEKMEALLPIILELGKTCQQILLLGGAGLVEQAAKLPTDFKLEALLIPGSVASFLINLTRST